MKRDIITTNVSIRVKCVGVIPEYGGRGNFAPPESVIIGQVYEVTETELCAFHMAYRLKGKPGRYPARWFKNLK